METKNNYNVNDILYNKWGYDCTSIDFYKIISKTEKTLTIQRLGSRVESGDPLRVYYVVPNEAETIGKPIRVIIRKDVPYLPERVQCTQRGLYKWDGKPQWCNTGYSL